MVASTGQLHGQLSIHFNNFHQNSLIGPFNWSNVFPRPKLNFYDFSLQIKSINSFKSTTESTCQLVCGQILKNSTRMASSFNFGSTSRLQSRLPSRPVTKVDFNGRQVDYRVDLQGDLLIPVKRTTNRRADAFRFSAGVARRRISFDSGAHVLAVAEEAEADPAGHRQGLGFSRQADPIALTLLPFHRGFVFTKSARFFVCLSNE